MNVAVEDLHRVIDGREEARRQGRARRPLARRIGRHRVRHLGLRRPAPAPTTSPAWSTSTAAAARRSISAQQATQELQSLDAPERSTVALVRRHPRALRRAVQRRRDRRPRCSIRTRRRSVRPPDCCPPTIVPPVRGHQRRPVRLRAQRRDLAAEPDRGAGAPRHGHHGDRAGPRLGRHRRAHADHPLRDDVLRRGHERRRRHRVVLPAAPDRRHRRRRQRQRQSGAERARRQRHDGSRPPEGPPDLRVRRAPRRRGACSTARDSWPTQSHIPIEQPDARQPSEHLRAQRPGRRVSRTTTSSTSSCRSSTRSAHTPRYRQYANRGDQWDDFAAFCLRCMTKKTRSATMAMTPKT